MEALKINKSYQRGKFQISAWNCSSSSLRCERSLHPIFRGNWWWAVIKRTRLVLCPVNQLSWARCYMEIQLWGPLSDLCWKTRSLPAQSTRERGIWGIHLMNVLASIFLPTNVCISLLMICVWDVGLRFIIYLFEEEKKKHVGIRWVNFEQCQNISYFRTNRKYLKTVDCMYWRILIKHCILNSRNICLCGLTVITNLLTTITLHHYTLLQFVCLAALNLSICVCSVQLRHVSVVMFTIQESIACLIVYWWLTNKWWYSYQTRYYDPFVRHFIQLCVEKK